MTIKQNGGIFGRNPTFNDIETDGTITSSGDIIANSKVRIEAATNITLQMKDTDGGFAASYLLVENGGRDLSIFAPQDIIFDQDGAETARFRDGGGLCFNGDTAAANALNDYEEGTWTPTYTTDGTDFDSVTYDGITSGNYTKIGNLVTLVARIRTDAITVGSASGNLVVGGIPFAPSANFGSASVYATSFASSEPRVMTPATASVLYIYKRTAADGADTLMTASEAGTGANNNLMYFTVSYQTA